MGERSEDGGLLSRPGKRTEQSSRREAEEMTCGNAVLDAAPHGPSTL